MSRELIGCNFLLSYETLNPTKTNGRQFLLRYAQPEILSAKQKTIIIIMLRNLFWIAILFSLRLNASAQIANRNPKPLIPLALGNHWIYYNNNREDKYDTLEIVDTKIINGDTAFVFNNGQLMSERNDSVYDFQSDRPGIPFKCLEYFPSEETIEFARVVRGDAIDRRMVSKLKRPFKLLGLECTNCYEYSDSDLYVVICRGIGIVQIKSANNTSTLMDYLLIE
jgi:hypothetical protein